MTSVVSAKEIPIWYICSQDLMKITYQYIQRRSEYSTNAYRLLKELISEDVVQKMKKYPKENQAHFYQNEL